jgi:hypothetical protein
LRRLDVAHADDLVALQPAGRLHLGDVARLLADQRPCDRRADRDETLLQVGLVVADDLVGHRRARILVLEIDGAAEDDPPVGVERGRIDDLRRGELALDLGDPALDEALLVLGSLVFRVLGDVTVRARLGDGLDRGMPLDGLESLQLGLQLFGAARGEWDRGLGAEDRKEKRAGGAFSVDE